MNTCDLACFLRKKEESANLKESCAIPNIMEYVSRLSSQNKIFRTKNYNSENNPPLAVKYCNYSSKECHFASADESGKLYVFQCASATPRISWKAHSNSVFDVIWSLDNEQIISASGDLTAALWDVETQGLVCVFAGHEASVKCVARHLSNKFEYASSSRDGSIMLWDTRCVGEKAFGISQHKPIDRINNAHSVHLNSKKSPFCSQTVTSVAFVSDLFAISSGASDGKIKIWDMRFMGAYSRTKSPVPYAVSPFLSEEGKSHGISSMSLTSDCSRVFATCLDNKVYELYTSNISQIQNTFLGSFYECNSFYVKSSLSMCDQFLATGSSSNGIHVWDINAKTPPVVIKGHEEEVTSVSWSTYVLGQLVSCSDDCTVRLWDVNS